LERPRSGLALLNKNQQEFATKSQPKSVDLPFPPLPLLLTPLIDIVNTKQTQRDKKINILRSIINFKIISAQW